MFTEKELKKLTRLDLLELLAVQGRELENLKEKKMRLTAELEKKKTCIQQAEDMASAAMELSGAYECVNRAVAQYLENVKRLAESQATLTAEPDAGIDQIAESDAGVDQIGSPDTGINHIAET